MKTPARKLLSFIAGIFLFCGIPLISWGIGDFRGYVENPARLAYLLMMALFSLLVVLFVPEEGRGSGKGVKTTGRQHLTLYLLQVTTMLILVVGPFGDRHHTGVFSGSQVLRWAGLSLALAGFSLMNWSVIVLGRQFSVEVTIQSGHRLVRHGPYRIIRHPRYAGILLFFTGLSFLFLSWTALIIIVLLFIILRWRICDEEALLAETFGKEWDDYKRQTDALFPLIY